MIRKSYFRHFTVEANVREAALTLARFVWTDKPTKFRRKLHVVVALLFAGKLDHISLHLLFCLCSHVPCSSSFTDKICVCTLVLASNIKLVGLGGLCAAQYVKL